MNQPPHDIAKCPFGEACSAHPPEWFTLGKDLMWFPLQLAHHKLSQRRTDDLSLDLIPELAAIHVMHSMSASVQANINGQHSVAIGLIRMCVEALTMVE